MKNKYTKAAEPLRDSDSMVLLFTVCVMKLLNVTGTQQFRKV